MSDSSTQNRRGFLRKGAAGFALAGMSAQTKMAWASLKQIAAGPAHVRYSESGPAGGRAVILLHDWPHDVADVLAAEGHHVIVPRLRVDNGLEAAAAREVIALMDGLGIGTAMVGGVDWGACVAVIMAALRPERCTAMLAVSGYALANLKAK